MTSIPIGLQDLIWLRYLSVLEAVTHVKSITARYRSIIRRSQAGSQTLSECLAQYTWMAKNGEICCDQISIPSRVLQQVFFHCKKSPWLSQRGFLARCQGHGARPTHQSRSSAKESNDPKSARAGGFIKLDSAHVWQFRRRRCLAPPTASARRSGTECYGDSN